MKNNKVHIKEFLSWPCVAKHLDPNRPFRSKEDVILFENFIERLFNGKSYFTLEDVNNSTEITNGDKCFVYDSVAMYAKNSVKIEMINLINKKEFNKEYNFNFIKSLLIRN